jgi:hypothetical protein
VSLGRFDLGRRSRRRQQRPLIVGVSSQGLAWLAPGQPDTAWESWTWAAPEDATVGFIDWLSHHAPHVGRSGRPVQVCLSPDIARHWMQPVPGQTASLAELHAVATATAQRLWGDAPDGGWLVTGQWKAVRPFLCTAVPAAWDRACLEVRARWGEMSFHTPLLLLLRRYMRRGRLGEAWPRDGWVAFTLAQHVFVLHLDDGQLSDFRCVRSDAAQGAAALEAAALQEARREMLRHGGQPETVYCPPDLAASHWPQESSAEVQTAFCVLRCSEELAHGN